MLLGDLETAKIKVKYCWAPCVSSINAQFISMHQCRYKWNVTLKEFFGLWKCRKHMNSLLTKNPYSDDLCTTYSQLH